MDVKLSIIGVLAAILAGGGAFILWYVISDARDRNKHYRIVVTVGDDNKIAVYRSKLTARGKEPLVVYPHTEQALVRIDVQMLDASVQVIDIRAGR
jgi:hypothetical protein